MNIWELIQELDGYGLSITDDDNLRDRLDELGVCSDAPAPDGCDKNCKREEDKG